MCLTYLDSDFDTEVALLVCDAKFIEPVSGWLNQGRTYFVVQPASNQGMSYSCRIKLK